MKYMLIIFLFSIMIYPQDLELIGIRGGNVSRGQIARAGSHFYIATSSNGFFYTNDTAIERLIKIPTSSYFYNFKTSQLDTNLLLANSFTDQFWSSDAGFNWNSNLMKTGINNESAINPLNPFIIYSIRNGKEVWKSFDKGKNWELIHKFRNSAYLIDVAPSDTSYIYCSADNSIYLSKNSGIQWEKQLSDTSDRVTALAINPLNKNTIYFDQNGLFKSYSNGINHFLTNGIVISSCLKISPVDTNIIYYSGKYASTFPPIPGIFRSTNGGFDWDKLQGGLPPYYYSLNLEMDPKDPLILWSGISELGVFKSTNGGDNWFPTNISYASQRDMHFFSKSNFVISAPGWGIWKTTNQGKDWYHPEINNDYWNGFAASIRFSPHTTNIGIAGWVDNIPVRTTDYGETWNNVSLGMDAYGCGQVSFSPFRPGLVFLSGTNDNGLGPNYTYRSFDYGLTFEKLNDSSNAFIYFDPTDSVNVYCLSFYLDAIFKSSDLGVNWQLVNHSDQLITKFYIDKKGNFYTILGYQGATKKGGIKKSTDKGQTWINLDEKLKELDPYTDMQDLLVDENREGRMYAVIHRRGEPFTSLYTNGGVYLTENNGISWRKIYDGEVRVMHSDGTAGGYVYLGTDFGIMKFLDTLSVTSVEEFDKKMPESYSLSQNYPNPFNPNTVIKYSIPANVLVTIKVYDVLGREIKTLVNAEKSIGSYEVNFNASNLPSGIYFYKFQAGKFSESKKMLLIK